MQKLLCKEHAYNQTCNQYAVPGICADIRRFLNILLVMAADDIHHSAGGSRLRDMGTLQIGQKVALQLIFIFPVRLQLGREVMVMRRCKGIHCVVYQLAHSVIIPKPELSAAFQAPG